MKKDKYFESKINEFRYFQAILSHNQHYGEWKSRRKDRIIVIIIFISEIFLVIEFIFSLTSNRLESINKLNEFSILIFGGISHVLMIIHIFVNIWEPKISSKKSELYSKKDEINKLSYLKRFFYHFATVLHGIYNNSCFMVRLGFANLVFGQLNFGLRLFIRITTDECLNEIFIQNTICNPTEEYFSKEGFILIILPCIFQLSFLGNCFSAIIISVAMAAIFFAASCATLGRVFSYFGIIFIVIMTTVIFVHEIQTKNLYDIEKLIVDLKTLSDSESINSKGISIFGENSIENIVKDSNSNVVNKKDGDERLIPIKFKEFRGAKRDKGGGGGLGESMKRFLNGVDKSGDNSSRSENESLYYEVHVGEKSLGDDSSISSSSQLSSLNSIK